MVKYTTTELINQLKKFPPETIIKNDIALIWEHPYYNDGEIINQEKYRELTMKKATTLYIFEGDWEKGTVRTYNDGGLEELMEGVK